MRGEGNKKKRGFIEEKRVMRGKEGTKDNKRKGG